MATKPIPFHVKGRRSAELVLQVLQPSTGKRLPVVVNADAYSRIQKRGKLRVNPQGYVCFTTRKPNEELLLSRFLLAPDGEKIPPYIFADHINRTPLDNRIENLQLVTAADNFRNSTATPVRAASGQTGVYWQNQAQKWQVKVHVDGRSKSLGLYSDLEEAASIARAAIAERDERIRTEIAAINSRRLAQQQGSEGERRAA